MRIRKTAEEPYKLGIVGLIIGSRTYKIENKKTTKNY